ncbi:MAG: PQQ-dependent sugar dehydrogenase, partial [Alphaproteobacteria bacterium]|nr:PQQ-dependent sugar dehydrogenase [Alphaproteobacteria bacterium]
PDGDVFLAEQGPGLITLLRDSDGDGKADLITTFAKGFSQPYGIAMHDGALYVADLRAVWRLPYRTGALRPTGPAQRITAAPDLRPAGWHTTRDIVFDRKGQLFLAIGSRGDVLEAPPPDATVQLVQPDGTMRTFASGLRNPAGMAIQPGTGDLWVTVNERDKLGGALPPDFLTRVERGDFFGWPYAYAGPHPDPVFGARRPDLVAKTRTPDVLFEAHSAPLGVVFYEGAQFPTPYRGDAFVALHGSGPYGAPDGYKVVRVHFAGGRPAGGYEDFVTGFSNNKAGNLRVWGTPCGLTIAKDGSLLIGDDKGRTIWRVSYIGH